MPVTPVSTTPVRAAVTVPGDVDLEFMARSTGGAPANVVVLYSVMDGAAVRIAEGASHTETIGTRRTVVRHNVGFGWTENPTPGLFRVQAMVTENGMPQFEQVWTIKVRSTATKQVMQAMETLDTDEGFTPLPDDVATILEEVAARKTAARKRSARKAAAKKGAAKRAGAKKTTAKKKSTAKKAGAKKSAVKKSGVKKSAAKKGGAKKSATKRTTAKRGAGAKKSGARKSASKKSATRKRASRR
jgi:hypothetical protein